MPAPNPSKQTGDQKLTDFGGPGQPQSDKQSADQDREASRTSGRPHDDRDPNSPTRTTQRIEKPTQAKVDVNPEE